MGAELGEILIFLAVAEEKGFRSAGARLGVSGSAVSQALRRLEERLGVALAYRTTRSFRLTEAGERLYEAVRPAVDEMEAAVTEVKELGEAPSGTLRLNVSSAAESLLRGSMLAGFLAAHPKIRLDLVVSEHTSEIVAAGYDAGVGLGEVIEQDMIALPVSGELRLLVVGSPSYMKHHPAPKHPRELTRHTCINWRPASGGHPYRWEFTEDGRDFSVSIDARVVTTDPVLNLRLAVAGVGLTMTWETWVREYVERGELVVVLEQYCPPFPGFYLYYPRRRHAPPALRALIDYVRGSPK
jgi:DNA-binding transcriptional LysR family regulator